MRHLKAYELAVGVIGDAIPLINPATMHEDEEVINFFKICF